MERNLKDILHMKSWVWGSLIFWKAAAFFPCLAFRRTWKWALTLEDHMWSPTGKIHDIARGLIRKVPRLNRFFLWIDDLLGYGRPPKEKNFWQVL